MIISTVDLWSEIEMTEWIKRTLVCTECGMTVISIVKETGSARPILRRCPEENCRGVMEFGDGEE